MSNYPYPRGMGTAIPSPPPPPATYERFSVGTSNGVFVSVTDTTIVPGPSGTSMSGLGVDGASTGKFLAVYFLTIQPAANLPTFYFGASPVLPPANGIDVTNLGLSAPVSVPHGWGCVVGFVEAQGGPSQPKNNGPVIFVRNWDFGQSGTLPLAAVPAVVAVLTDLTNSRQYVAWGPSMAGLVWQIGNPFTGTGGLQLHSGVTYFPAVAVRAGEQSSLIANWGSGPLPGYVGAWVPPGAQGWQ